MAPEPAGRRRGAGLQHSDATGSTAGGEPQHPVRPAACSPEAPIQTRAPAAAVRHRRGTGLGSGCSTIRTAAPSGQRELRRLNEPTVEAGLTRTAQNTSDLIRRAAAPLLSCLWPPLRAAGPYTTLTTSEDLLCGVRYIVIPGPQTPFKETRSNKNHLLFLKK